MKSLPPVSAAIPAAALLALLLGCAAPVPESASVTGAVPMGALVVRSNVHGDLVVIDDRPVGPSGPQEHAIPAGWHSVSVTKAGHAPWKTEVELAAGETRIVRARLQRQARASAPVPGPDRSLGSASVSSPDPSPGSAPVSSPDPSPQSAPARGPDAPGWSETVEFVGGKVRERWSKGQEPPDGLAVTDDGVLTFRIRNPIDSSVWHQYTVDVREIEAAPDATIPSVVSLTCAKKRPCIGQRLCRGDHCSNSAAVAQHNWFLADGEQGQKVARALRRLTELARQRPGPNQRAGELF